MSDDKIAEIRERYEGYSLNSGNAGKANEDRGWLLAEVDRLRADLALEQSGLVLQRGEIEKLRAEIERMKRDSDEACDESNPVQEPVAWRNKNWGHFTINPIASNHPDWEPLYTEQQTRQRRNALEGKP